MKGADRSIHRSSIYEYILPGRRHPPTGGPHRRVRHIRGAWGGPARRRWVAALGRRCEGGMNVVNAAPSLLSSIFSLVSAGAGVVVVSTSRGVAQRPFNGEREREGRHGKRGWWARSPAHLMCDAWAWQWLAWMESTYVTYVLPSPTIHPPFRPYHRRSMTDPFTSVYWRSTTTCTPSIFILLLFA